MFKLTIRKQDGSTYWVEHFNTEAELHRWLDEEKTRPYWDRQYTTEIEDITPPPHVPTYQELRAAEYPPHTDYLDAIVKGDEAQKQAYIDACLAVKAKYPKPESHGN